jgi:UBX domain-containing protein 6
MHAGNPPVQAAQSCEVLGRVLRNILAEPAEAKFRRLRLANKRICETVVDVEGGIDVLQV